MAEIASIIQIKKLHHLLFICANVIKINGIKINNEIS